MGFLDRIIRAVNRPEKRDAMEMMGTGGLSNFSAISNFLDGGAHWNASREIVNDWTATSISTVYTCCRILCDSIASLPCLVYKQTSTGKQLDTDNSLLHLLSVEANPETSAYSFFEALILHLHLRGNAYAQIERDFAGNPVAFWNLDPRKTEPVRLDNGSLAYKTRDGEQAGQTRVIAAKDMLHIILFSWDGIVGQSPIGTLRESLGLALSQQKYMAHSLINSSVPAAALSIPQKMRPEDKSKAREEWESLNLGANQRRIAILDNGMTIQTLGLNNEDQQLLESRSFSRSEIAAAFRVPASMVGDLTRLSNSNHEQQSLTFVQDTLMPLLKRIEIEFKRKLLPPAPNGKPNNTIIMFDLRERLRGDFQSTMNAYGTGRQWGFYSVNDVRRELGEDTIGPEGDQYIVPVNMQNSARLLDTESIQDQPVGNDPVIPNDNQRSRNLRLFRDAVGRLAARPAETRDLGTVRQVFGPLLASVAELEAEIARRRTDAQDWQFDSTKALSDYMNRLQERAAQWKPSDLDAIAAQELHKVTKTLALAAHRSAGEYVAMKGLANVT